MATGAERLLAALRRWGVGQVFCCPGTTETPLLVALAAAPEEAERFVLTTHEAIAVSMADGYARAGGGVAVAYLHTHVGLANGLAHLSAAQLAGTPLVVLVGVKPTPTLSQRALTTTPYLRDIARPWVKEDWQVLRADAFADDLRRSVQMALAPPRGPTLLVVPQDVLAAEVDDHDVAPLASPACSAPSPPAVQAAVARLLAGRRVLLVAGSGLRTASAMAAVHELARALDAPVVAESRRDLERTAVSTEDPAYCGLLAAGQAPASEADVVLVAGSGTFLEFEPGRGPLLPTGADLIHLCDDPAEIGRRHPPAVSLLGDPELGLRALIAGVGPDGVSAERGEFRRRMRDAYLERCRTVATANTRQARAVRALCAAAADDDVLVVDAVTATEPLLEALRRTTPGRLHTTASGSLGWGMGAALGVALADRDLGRRRRVLAVVGDGVAQFGLPALHTAKRLGLPVTYVVLNNGRYRAVAGHAARQAGVGAEQIPLTDISGVDLVTVARGFGLEARRISEGLDDLGPALGDPDAGPRLLDVPA